MRDDTGFWVCFAKGRMEKKFPVISPEYQKDGGEFS